MNEKASKIITHILNFATIIIIALFAYSLAPKTLQNDTFYTVKIGEHIVNNTDKITDLLPWNKGLDMKDPFSWNENLPYTYPHWLYDLGTYEIYTHMGGFQGIYLTTCILSSILGLSIYFVNMRLNKNRAISLVITLASLYCLKNFIAARAQLITFILFIFTLFSIEQFIKNKKIGHAILLIIIPILIANIHSAVWPFYFVIYLPYIAEYLIYLIVTTDYQLLYKKINFALKAKFSKRKFNDKEIEDKKLEFKVQKEKHKENVKKILNNTYKIKLNHEKNVKWLIIIMIICAFTGLLTPIKDTPYTYLIKTNQGNTTQNISEHLPLTLIQNTNMITILVLVLGILTFTKTKINLRDLFMLLGLIFLSFMSQRQVSMLVLLGNFILVRMICELFENKIMKRIKSNENILVQSIIVLIIVCIAGSITIKYDKEKKNDVYVSSSSYPVQASNYILDDLIPKIGIENLRLYNEYNYGSYLLYRGIPVFIDSRADLYTPEFNGEKDENGNYQGRDIFTDFLNISSLASNYESEFNKYGVTHVMTYSNSKLNSLISKDEDYTSIYEDSHFVIYEKINY